MKKLFILIFLTLSLFASEDYSSKIDKLLPLARQGNVKAEAELAEAYFKRHISYTDYILARKYFEKLDTPKSNYYLGCIYAEGLGAKKDLLKAVKFLEKSKLPEAKYGLAKLYMDDKSILKDVKSAKKLLEEAAKEGNGDAQFMLGKLYLTNNSVVDKDLSKAAKLIKESYKNGVKEAYEVWNKNQLWRYVD